MNKEFVSKEEVLRICSSCCKCDKTGKNKNYPYCNEYSSKCFSVCKMCVKTSDEEMERSITNAEKSNTRYWNSVIEW